MELEHTTVKELKLLDSAAREQPVEFDLALPEYYPPVGRILKCFVTPTEEAVTFADGRVSVAGCAAMRLLYADDENRLHCYRTEAKYTKILQTDARDANAAVLVSQDVRTINCRALGPKRVEIKANISVRAALLGIAETETVSAAGEDLQLRAETADYCEPVCVYERDFLAEDFVRREANGQKLRTVISACASPVPEKTEIVANKLMIRGKDTVTVLCAGEEGSVVSCELSVPFSEVLDCYGVGEDTACEVLFTRCEAEVSLPEEGDDAFDVTVSHRLLLLASRRRPLTCVSDAYPLRGDAECRFTEALPARSFAQTSEEARLSAVLEAYEDGGFTVKCVFISDVSFTADDTVNGKTEGTLCFNVVIADGENRLSLLSRTAVFSHPYPDGSRCVACGVTAKDPTAEALPDGKIAVSCTLSFRMLTQTGERTRLLTEVKEAEAAGDARPRRAVIYFAEKGEPLWNIAKENRSSVAEIKALNSLSSDVVESDARLIFSGF